MASTTKLIVYNATLRELGSAPLADTTTANTRLAELDGAWDHAIEYVLSLRDWGFARRRATLTGVADTSFPPYTYRYTKPSDYLRKCWLKDDAETEYQVDHAEIAAVFYALQDSALIEYVSDHSDNYNPANWPPHFTRVLTLFLASLVAQKLARAGAGDVGMLDGKMSKALEEADTFESVFLTNVAIDPDRQPVFRRALEFLGQELAGTVQVHAHTDMLRWHMNRAWTHALRYVLEQGAWNFATRRLVLQSGGTEDPLVSDLPTGFFWWLPTFNSNAAEASTDTQETSQIDEFEYGFTLPSSFLHKIWVKADVNHDMECKYKFMGNALYTNVNPTIMEYIALDGDSGDPTRWSANFMEAVAAYLAYLVCTEIVVVQGKKGARIEANQLRDKLMSVYRMKLSDAKLRDAIQQETMKIPLGRFARSRMGSIGSTSIRRYN